MKNQPMHNCEGNECDNRNSIDVLEVKIARLEKMLIEKNKEIQDLKKYKNHLRNVLNDILSSPSKVFALLIILGFVINAIKGG